MTGGTTICFATDGDHVALKRAQGKDVQLSGDVARLRQSLHAGWIDKLHLVVAPVLLGEGFPQEVA
jgi:dihydrofolate reductase